MLELAEEDGGAWCAGRENKCHHESLRYRETRMEGIGIRIKKGNHLGLPSETNL